MMCYTTLSAAPSAQEKQIQFVTLPLIAVKWVGCNVGWSMPSPSLPTVAFAIVMSAPQYTLQQVDYSLLQISFIYILGVSPTKDFHNRIGILESCDSYIQHYHNWLYINLLGESRQFYAKSDIWAPSHSQKRHDPRLANVQLWYS